MSESARDVRMICPPPSPYDPSMLSIREAPRGAPQSFTTEAARVKRRAVCGAPAGCVVIEKEEIRSQRGRSEKVVAHRRRRRPRDEGRAEPRGARTLHPGRALLLRHRQPRPRAAGVLEGRAQEEAP